MKEITVIVASTNPVKIEAAKIGFEKMFPGSEIIIEGVSIKSGVSDQPMDSDETRTGARNRAINVRKERPAADFFVGLEGGVTRDNPQFNSDQYHLRSVVWCAILSKTSDVFGEGEPGSYSLPFEVAKLIVDEKMELGHADDKVFRKTNSKQGEGSVGILTHGVLNRGPYYVQAVLLALIPFRNPDLYSKSTNLDI